MLKSLIDDVGTHKAILHEEAKEKYGEEAVRLSLDKRYLLATPTGMGEALSLAHRGRKTIGLKGAYSPSVGAVANALAVRHVVSSLLSDGYETESIGRRSAVRVKKGQEHFIVMVRYTGYDYATIRRVFFDLIVDGEASELKVYVGRDKIDRLNRMVWPKLSERHSRINPETLKILIVPVA